MVGRTVSATVTVNVAVLVPNVLVAVAVTVVVPSGNVPGMVGSNDTAGVGSPLTSTSGAPTAALHAVASVDTAMSFGGVTNCAPNRGVMTTRPPPRRTPVASVTSRAPAAT